MANTMFFASYKDAFGKETIHDWWQDYEIADGTEDNLLAYIGG